LLQAQVVKPRSTAAQRTFAALSLPGAFEHRTYRFRVEKGSSPRRYSFSAKEDSGVAIVGQTTKLSIGSLVIGETAPEDFTVILRDHDDAITRFGEKLTFDKSKSDVAHFSYAADDSVSAAAAPNLLIDLYLATRKGVDRGLNQ